MEKGFPLTLTTLNFQQIPAYAQLIQNWVKEIGIDLKLNIMDENSYYGDVVFGKSVFLDSVMGISQWGHRGVPNVYLTAMLKSDGILNASRFKNKDFDILVNGYITSLDLDAMPGGVGQDRAFLARPVASALRILLRPPDRRKERSRWVPVDSHVPAFPSRRRKGVRPLGAAEPAPRRSTINKWTQ